MKTLKDVLGEAAEAEEKEIPRGQHRTPKRPRAEQATSDDLEVLPEITDKEHKFIMAIMDGMNNSDAYRHAYDCDGSSDRTIWGNASKVRNSAKVVAWLTHLRTTASADITVTRESHLRELERIKEMALANGNYGAASQCEVHKGKVIGAYVERVEVTGQDSDLASIQSDLEQQWGRDLARQMMAHKGLPWVLPDVTH